MDNYVWIFLFITVCTMFLALETIDRFYSWLNDITYVDNVYKSEILVLIYFNLWINVCSSRHSNINWILDR